MSGLSGVGPPPGVHDQPRVGELDHAWVLLQHDLAAEDIGVEGARPRHASHRDELGDEEALARGGQTLEVDGRLLAHGFQCSSYAFYECGDPLTGAYGDRPRTTAWARSRLGPAICPGVR